MYSLSRCINPTYLCGYAKYLFSYKAAQGREKKFREIRAYISPWFWVCTKAMFISKGSLDYGDPKNVFD